MTRLARTHRTPLITASLLALGAVAYSFAGDLMPPVGPVSPTFKTLDEVEPRTTLANDFQTLTPIVIDQPGSYYLTENIQALPGQIGIQILASRVTLDLNGFSVVANGEVGSTSGIRVGDGSSEHSGLHILSGSIVGFSQEGIDASNATNSVFTDLRLAANGSNGLITSSGATIHRCVATANGNNAISADSGSTVTDCTASDNNDDGFAGSNCVFRGCSAWNNTGDGFRTSSCLVVDCIAQGNTGHGVSSGFGGSVHGCALASNDAGPLSLVGGSTEFENHP